MRNASPRQFCRIALCLFLPARWLTTKSCAIRWSTIVRAFSDVPCSATLSPTLLGFPSRYCTQDTAVWKNFRKVRRSGVVHVGDQILRFFALRVDFLRLAQVLKEGFLVLVVLELLDQLLDLVPTCCTPPFQ